MGKQRGFTLLELLMTVVVIAILAAVAVPSYSSYMRKARLHDAFTSLIALHTQEELYWTNNHSYGQSDCGIGALPAGATYFSLTCNLNNSQQGYLITAKGLGSLLNYNFTIDQAGNKVTIDFPGVSGLPTACWLYAPGSCF